METKLNVSNMAFVRRKLGFMNGLEVSTDGSKGGLCLAWNGNYVVSLRSYVRNFINVDILDEDSNFN